MKPCVVKGQKACNASIPLKVVALVRCTSPCTELTSTHARMHLADDTIDREKLPGILLNDDDSGAYDAHACAYMSPDAHARPSTIVLLLQQNLSCARLPMSKEFRRNCRKRAEDL
eukprot:3823146-Pleurochrysis_carterae.AAC.2